MLNLNSIMLGTTDLKALGAFYEKVLGRPADMAEEGWFTWNVGSTVLSIGYHSEMKGAAKDPGRVMFNFETPQVKEEFERIKGVGAKVIKEPYDVGGGMWIATFADLDGNFFQLMSPWEGK